MKTFSQLDPSPTALKWAVARMEQRYAIWSPDYTSITMSEMAPLVRALSPNDRVRQLAVAALKTGVWPTQEDAQLLVTALNHSSLLRWRRRAVAAYLLSVMTMDEEHREITARALCRVIESKNAVNFAGDAFMRAGIIALISLMVAGIFGAAGGGLLGFTKALSWGAAFISGISALALVPSFISSELAHRDVIMLRSVWALSNLLSPGSIGTLARIVVSTGNSFPINNIAVLAIARICRALIPDQYGHLSRETTPGLCRLLHQQDDELVMVVLEALGKVGDGRAVQPVASLVRRGATEDIRTYAAHLLPILEERKRHENDPSRLLRPASAVPGQQLLRPAAHGRPANSGYLLRPTVEIVYRPRPHNRVS